MPFATVDGSRIHYLEAGSGDPPVVLLHAFPLHAAMWQPQLDGLSDRWRVIAPDLPGCGRSDPLDDLSMDSMADATAGLLAELGLPPAVVGGQSMGGYVTFALLRRHRSRLRAVVLADTRAGADTPEVRERRTRQQAQAAEEGTGPLVEAMLQSLPGDQTRRERGEVMALLRQLMGEVSPDCVIAALEAMKGRADATEELAGIDLPALVVVGDEDSVAPPDVAEDMARRLPRARLAVLPGAGHLSSLEVPDAFTAELRALLEDLS
jgi:pimeloyl-ACP methyl ester carboxylesterase